MRKQKDTKKEAKASDVVFRSALSLVCYQALRFLLSKSLAPECERSPFAIHSDSYRHVFHFELINGFHPQSSNATTRDFLMAFATR